MTNIGKKMMLVLAGGIIMSEIVYCWNGCMDKDTNWWVIMKPIVHDGEDLMWCPDCNHAWEPDYEQIPHGPPHKQRMEGIARYIEEKEQD